VSRDDGSAIGAVLGVGAIAGAVFLISRRASAMTRGSPRERGFSLPEAPIGKFPLLVERWRTEVAKRSRDLPVDAILEWILIESGGDMCSTGTPGEAGIFQLSFPDDAKYGATLERLRAICERSKRQNPADISWLSEEDLDMEVGAGVRKILAARDTVRHVFTQSGVAWPETSFDFGSAVKQIHATPGVITELVPKIVRASGPLNGWSDLRARVLAFPIDQMSPRLRQLAIAPSRYGLKDRLEDTMRNAEFVGHAWAGSYAAYA
jgi:hypothetical protein